MYLDNLLDRVISKKAFTYFTNFIIFLYFDPMILTYLFCFFLFRELEADQTGRILSTESSRSWNDRRNQVKKRELRVGTKKQVLEP